MITLASQVKTLAPGTSLVVPMTGSIFSCSNATAGFKVSFDGGPFIPMQAGWCLDMRPEKFNTLVIENPSAVALTLAFYVTTATVGFATNFNPATYTKGSGLLALDAFGGAHDSVTFSGLDGINIRRQIMCTPATPGAGVWVKDANGNYLTGFSMGMIWTVETGGPITFQNMVAAPINILVGEIFYAT